MDGVVVVRDAGRTTVLRQVAPATKVVVAGFAGPRGQTGDKGDAGTGISVLGTYTTLADLQAAHPTGGVGDAYMVGANLYVWDAVNVGWHDAGPFQGPPGTSGQDISLPVGAVVQSGRVVRGGAGQLWPVDLAVESDAEQVIGVATQSVTTVGQACIARTAGLLTDSGWAWQPGIVWCGPDGVLTQAPGSTGWLLQVGRVLDSTTINIDIESPIYRG